MPLLICATCPRYDTRRSGQFARALKAAIATDGRDVTVKGVQCLGGCPGDGVVALDGPGMTRVRFTHLDADDAGAVIDAAAAHADSGTGDLADWTMPPALADRLSSVTTKRGPLAGRSARG